MMMDCAEAVRRALEGEMTPEIREALADVHRRIEGMARLREIATKLNCTVEQIPARVKNMMEKKKR